MLNAFGGLEIYVKNIPKIVSFFIFITSRKWLRSQFGHESFLGRFCKAKVCQKRVFIFWKIDLNCQLPWEKTGTTFWDTP